MKNLILILVLFLFSFSSCEKNEQIVPEVDYVQINIELYGSLPIGVYTETGPLTFDRADFEALSYTIKTTIDGNENVLNIDKNICVGFLGSFYLHKIIVRKNDNIKVEIVNNNYPNSTYMFLRTYSKPHKIVNLYFEDKSEFTIQGEYFF